MDQLAAAGELANQMPSTPGDTLSEKSRVPPAACSTTSLEKQWRDPDYEIATSAPQKIFVVAASQNDERRRLLENQFAERLNKAGVESMSV